MRKTCFDRSSTNERTLSCKIQLKSGEAEESQKLIAPFRREIYMLLYSWSKMRRNLEPNFADNNLFCMDKRLASLHSLFQWIFPPHKDTKSFILTRERELRHLLERDIERILYYAPYCSYTQSFISPSEFDASQWKREGPKEDLARTNASTNFEVSKGLLLVSSVRGCVQTSSSSSAAAAEAQIYLNEI
jgi:hypothetical protein